VLESKDRSSIVFVIAVVSLTDFRASLLQPTPTSCIYCCPQTIKAPFDAQIDTKATAANRKAASKGSVPVWMIDTAVNQKIDQDLQQALAQGNQLR